MLRYLRLRQHLRVFLTARFSSIFLVYLLLVYINNSFFARTGDLSLLKPFIYSSYYKIFLFFFWRKILSSAGNSSVSGLLFIFHGFKLISPSCFSASCILRDGISFTKSVASLLYAS